MEVHDEPVPPADRSRQPVGPTGQVADGAVGAGRELLDEDVPGGTTAYMMRQVIDEQGGYWSLDAPPVTVSAQPHRPAYGSDGDYWSKPNREELFRAVYELMHESDPTRFAIFW